ncbi:NlpC/P60 family protein [Pararhodobacter aggregans]|uniref:NLP/P60 hydrolase n=1 Tax=Pararhodobacter aggregans TaxID=404875 RepID=A0A2T7UNM4_9RHOB|nr:NlpC/P60 family protein [Pararhodobacter aggregans]PTX00796.1 NlpC/P60 family protein [Pararhodobacter aggregans]PVE46325.1 NLP/P60 hydrolase [Pararhodobacter aggregans]
MTDRRYFRAAGGVAHDSLKGALEGVLFVPGRWLRVVAPLADLCATPGGARDRQMLLGTRICVITECDGHAFGFDGDEGYCGWIAEEALGDDLSVSHWVAAPATHVYGAPDIKQRERMALSMGARLQVTGEVGRFAVTPGGYVPARHLRKIGDWRADAVAVARDFLGTPYLWGGNSRDGIDCSGLVQAAFRALGRDCPGDSDLQSLMEGAEVLDGAEEAGDLIFWAGHVAMVSEPGRLIHANAHHMAVTEEPMADVLARAEEPVIRRLRVG